MKALRILAGSVLALSLGGCTTPIDNSANPAASLFGLIPSPLKATITTDMASTAYNYDQAHAIGILPADSPIPLCVHSINEQLGIEIDPNAAPVQSFTPKVDGLASAGSVVVIDALKLQQLQAHGINISQDCITTFGLLTLKGMFKVFGVAGGLPVNITPTGPHFP